jgi:hypothetical protein
MARPTFAAAAMYGVVTGIAVLFPAGSAPIVELGVLVLAGALTYGALSLAFNRATFHEAAGLMLPARLRPRGV